ncbi:MAG: hypothetical protein ABIO40_07710 [Devosia sp.]
MTITISTVTLKDGQFFPEVEADTTEDCDAVLKELASFEEDFQAALRALRPG